MIQVNKDKCIGCGACVKECPTSYIALEKGKAAGITKRVCMECGHCVAVCPADAVRLGGYDHSDVIPGSVKELALEPEALMNAIKGRRSIRRFQTRPVEREKIEQIIEAGRFSATGGNRQAVSYVVLQDKLEEFKLLAFDEMVPIGNRYLATPGLEKRLIGYARRFLKMGEEYRESGGKKDGLFFHAPAAIVLIGDNPIDVGLAASNMELMTFALGLGMLYSGFTVRVADGSKRVREYLEVPEGYEVHAALVVGYPDVEFRRTVPRKKAAVGYK